MIPAMQWVVVRGGIAIRMGSISEQDMPGLSPRVIDYTKTHHSDFMGIYLSAK